MSSSVYLTDKCESLAEVLRFMKKHPIQFLAQIDFWDWEVENLLFSFQNFDERSKAWGNESKVREKLSEFGLVLSRDAEWNLHWHPIRESSKEVVVPRAKLLEVINLWNSLLRLCEKTHLGDEMKPKLRDKYGYVSALEKFTKQIPDSN